MSGGEKATKRAINGIRAAGGLVTPKEIADEWGVSQQAVADRIARGAFPEPLKVAGRVRLYLRSQIEAYDRNRLRQPGEPVPVTGQYALVDNNGRSGGRLLLLSEDDRFPSCRDGFSFVLARTEPRPSPAVKRPRSIGRYPLGHPRRRLA